MLGRTPKWDRTIAHQLKTHFDVNFTPGPWHCIVGRKYGSRVTHETGHFLYMHLGNQAIIFKTNALDFGEILPILKQKVNDFKLRLNYKYGIAASIIPKSMEYRRITVDIKSEMARDETIN
uniref:Dynein light chain n=1 Tax=Romanomermis culicivorax TaxID=13658 RepID=A0A915ISK9_ROMCU